MADEKSQNSESADEEAAIQTVASGAEDGVSRESEAVEFEGAAPAHLGSDKYVQAAFLAAGVLIAYLTGKILAALWNTLAEMPAVYEHIPFLLRYAEDERPTFTMPVGLVIGVICWIRAARHETISRWAKEVASELSKVHWPDKETVTNGTIVVLVASAVATVYIGLLDRLWMFVTQLVYGNGA